MSRLFQFWKTSAIAALAALLVLQAGGWFLASGILQFQAKIAAHVALHRRETPLETVTLAASFLSKIRVGKKEIRLEGRLYDIKSQTIKGDSVALTLYHDRYEEAVLDAVGHLLSPVGCPNEALPLQNWLAKWLGATFLLPQTPAFAAPDLTFILHFFTCLMPAAQNAPGCFSPPPEF